MIAGMTAGPIDPANRKLRSIMCELTFRDVTDHPISKEPLRLDFTSDQGSISLPIVARPIPKSVWLQPMAVTWQARTITIHPN
jgi:hypothetical protein